MKKISLCLLLILVSIASVSPIAIAQQEDNTVKKRMADELNEHAEILMGLLEHYHQEHTKKVEPKHQQLEQEVLGLGKTPVNTDDLIRWYNRKRDALFAESARNDTVESATKKIIFCSQELSRALSTLKKDMHQFHIHPDCLQKDH